MRPSVGDKSGVSDATYLEMVAEEIEHCERLVRQPSAHADRCRAIAGRIRSAGHQGPSDFWPKCGHRRDERNTYCVKRPNKTYEYCRLCMNARVKVSSRRRGAGRVAFDIGEDLIRKAAEFWSVPQIRRLIEDAIEAKVIERVTADGGR